jgi:hypothetical protein
MRNSRAPTERKEAWRADFDVATDLPQLHQVAQDPRIPPELEALPMQVAAVPGLRRVDWYIDGKQMSSTTVGHYAWPLVRGSHEVYTRIWDDAAGEPHETNLVRFHVH